MALQSVGRGTAIVPDGGGGRSARETARSIGMEQMARDLPSTGELAAGMLPYVEGAEKKPKPVVA